MQETVRADAPTAIAYVLGSRFWGRGLASDAVCAMLGKLAGAYAVSDDCAVLKQRNQRSLQLLERLGFERVAPAEASSGKIEEDELMMRRASRRIVSSPSLAGCRRW
ncbi:MAG: GNAT family N-acetyltransferase [Pseudomonadota bacterium]|nr:GNAT family N-acetyltransferase [Pseudomonadota bacterium]